MTTFLYWLAFVAVMMVASIAGLVVYLLLIQRQEARLDEIPTKYVDEWKRPKPRP